MSKRDAWTPEQKARELAQARARKKTPEYRAADAIRQAERRRTLTPAMGPYVPMPPRGPSDPAPAVPPMHEGHELAGVSTLTKDGETVAEWNKTRVAGAELPPTPIPESFLLDRTSRMQRGDGSTLVQWSSYSAQKKAQWEGIKAAIALHVAEHVQPVPPVPTLWTPTSDDLLVCYPLGDPHIGMLAWGSEVGEHFDVRIAERELCACMEELVARAPASTECIIVNLGDFWHAQDDKQTTPRGGNKLDVDGRAGKVGRIGLSLLRRLIDTALTKHARVTFRSIPGNHDPHSSFWIPEVMRAAYANDPRVIVKDGYNPYQYDTFGACALGWAHGDGAKIDALGEIMLADEPAMCGAATYRYWNTGHVHHWQTKEFRTCVVSTHRTLAGRDAWHHHAGYRSGRALKALTYHRRWGLDGESIVSVERVRDAILRKAA